MKKYIKTITLLLMLPLTTLFQVDAQELYYGTGQWDPQGPGNHRAVIYAEQFTEAVTVKIPWRRLDYVDSKNLVLIDALTGYRVNNLFSLTKNQDYGEIVFEPVSGEGLYYLYYMPGRVTGRWWHPDAVYEKPEETWDPEWKKNVSSGNDLPEAKVISFESVSDYHSFYPMEIPVTEEERAALLDENRDKDFLIFPENRNYPTRMMETVPLRWIQKGVNEPFEGTARQNESYAWQLGIYAPFKPLNNLSVRFSDLKNEKGELFPASAMKCINMGGKDHLGHSFSKKVNIPEGEVRSMWIISDINRDQSPGIYKGKVTVSANGTRNYTVDVILDIRDEVAENRGYRTPQNQSRLNWLDSDIGLDNKLIAPFTPVEVKGQTVSILGRRLTFNKSGFPETILSTFSSSNHDVTGPGKNIIAEPLRFELLKNGEEISFRARKPKITLHTEGAVAWQTTLVSDQVDISVKAKMECDGYVDYQTVLTAKEGIDLEDVRLIVPYEKSTARYLMGMGKQGGYTPEKLEWKWQQEYANNMIWIGDVNAGMQLKLKHLVPDWKLATFESTGPYRDWSNDGKGGCRVISSSDEVRVTAYTGAKTLKKGEEMVLNFGLLITPLKTLDDKHWNERYYHADNDPVKAAEYGATIMNIHHANVYNPYINYPFLSADTLKAVVQKAKSLGIRTKLYYTVRELTTHLPELWALRHLDDEIFSRTNETILADTHVERDPNSIYGMTGHSWLVEHLRSNYDPAWHDPSVGKNGDMSIRTQGLSRWHNYYIKGLDFLIRNFGIRGLYLDGVGYDREIMKRIRKTMDRAADSCLIDFHSGNAFSPVYGLNSPANNYMELFPYVNSLWLGEGYDYNAQPDYWLTEISGIPFGLYGEMLQGCGNPFRGMVYGMSTRFYGSCRPMNIWKLWDYFGMTGSEYTGYWDEANPVDTGNKNVLAGVYRKKDKTMIAMGNWTPEDQMASLTIDWDELGIDPETAYIEIPPIDGLQEKETANIADLLIPGGQGMILIVYKNK